MGMHRRAAAVLLALTLTTGAAACGDDDGGGDDGGGPGGAPLEITDGGTFTFGLEAEADGLSPTLSRFAISGHLVASAVFDPLASFNEKDEVVPFLAESIEPSEDLKTWTITLPEGITFHDDSPLDAAVVAANLQAHLESPLTKAALVDVATVEATGPMTVTVTTKQPWASFPYILTTQVGYVQSAAMLEAGRAGVSTPVGTGPFVYESFVQGDRWTGIANPNYWREGLPHVANIEFRTIVDDITRQSALTTGDVDMVHTDYGPDVATFRARDDVQIFEDPDGEEEFIILNLAVEPFDSLTARQAVAAATDLDLYAQTIGEGVLEPINGPFAEGQLGYTEDTGYPEFDLARAAALVKQYEEEEGKPLAFEVSSVPTPQGLNEIQLLAGMWEEAGMEVELFTSDQAAHIIRVITGGHQAAYWRLFSSVDPDGDYVWWHGRNAFDPPTISLNFARNRDDQLDAALDRARQTSDLEVREAAYQEVSQRMGATVPYIWLSRVTWLYAASPKVHGLENMQGGGLGSLAAKTWIGEVWLEQ